MSVFAKVDSFNVTLDAATTTHAHSGYGFSPKFFANAWSGRTESANTIGRADIQSGFGMAIPGIEESATMQRSADAAPAADSDQGLRDDSFIGSLTSGGGFDGYSSVQSFDADGFTDVVDVQHSINLRNKLLALGGSEIETARVIVTEPGSTGNQAITTPFQPDAIIIHAQTAPGAYPISSGDSRRMVGMGCFSNRTAAIENFVIAGGSNDGSDPTQTVTYGYNGECIALLDLAVTALTSRAAWSARSASSITLNWLEISGISRTYVIYLIKGGLWDLRTVAMLTSTGTVQLTGHNFLPVGGMALYPDSPSLTQDTPQDKDENTIGMFAWNPSGTLEQGLVGLRDADGAGDTVCTTIINNNNIVANLNDPPSIDGSIAALSRAVNNLTLDQTDPDPVGRDFGIMFFGSAEEGGKLVNAGLVNNGLVGGRIVS